MPESERAWLRLIVAGDSLEVFWDAPYWSEAEPKVPPGECGDLWKYQAIELFLGCRNEPGYLEFEFGPAGHWLALEFSDYRHLLARRQVHSFTWCVQAERWTGRALIQGLPLLMRICVGNAHLVHRCVHGRAHCSHHGDPAAAPDFHRSDLFLPLDGGSPSRV